jgi:hypothetical protein
MANRLYILLSVLILGLAVGFVDARRDVVALRAERDELLASRDESTTPVEPAPAPPPPPPPTQADTLVIERSVRVTDPSDSIALLFANERIAYLERRLAARDARGFLTFPSSKGGTVRYLGDVVDGMATGTGHGVWSTGSLYEGEWRANLKHGRGSYTWPDGERYEGEFRDDQRSGDGTYTWKDGRRWVGGWLDDMRHGDGVLYEANGRVRVRGRWEKDKLVQEVRDRR